MVKGHHEKINQVENFLLKSESEYMLIYGEPSSGKFLIASQAYNILSDANKEKLYIVIHRQGSKTVQYGDKTAPIKKTIILRNSLDWISNEYINDFNALSVEFTPDPIYFQYSIYNLNNEFRKWLRTYPQGTLVDGKDNTLMWLIAIRDEYLVLNQLTSTPSTLFYAYGLNKKSVRITFTDTEIIIEDVSYVSMYLRKIEV